MSFQYLHKMRCKGTHFFPYMQEQNAYHVIFSANLAVFRTRACTNQNFFVILRLI